MRTVQSNCWNHPIVLGGQELTSKCQTFPAKCARGTWMFSFETTCKFPHHSGKDVHIISLWWMSHVKNKIVKVKNAFFKPKVDDNTYSDSGVGGCAMGTSFSFFQVNSAKSYRSTNESKPQPVFWVVQLLEFVICLPHVFASREACSLWANLTSNCGGLIC